MKDDITYDVDGDLVDLLKPAHFSMKINGQYHYGFIAQDVQDVTDDIVCEINEPGVGEHLGLYYNDFIPLLTAKIQKHTRIIKDQQSLIEQLEQRIAQLERG